MRFFLHILFRFLTLQILLLHFSNGFDLPSSCPNLTFGSIPSDHLYHKKVKPLIIAHRGQSKVYQENTYDGIISTIDLKADGFELDIFLTKDEKLVVFHDDDTEALTGIKMTIWNSTYKELSTLNITTKITKGGKTYVYDKPRKIPLLEDILKATKDANVIHYLEMKPSSFRDPADLAKRTGTLVADMVLKHNLLKKSIIVSFDYRKVHAVKQRNPDITVGTLFKEGFIDYPKTYLVENSFKNLTQCLNDAPDGKIEFFKFLLESGILFKYSGSSSFDADIKLYNNPKYTNNTISILQNNYKADISTGFYTVYYMSNTEEENKKNEEKMMKLIAEGGGCRVITDDVPKLRNVLGRNNISGAVSQSKMKNMFLGLVFILQWWVLY